MERTIINFNYEGDITTFVVDVFNGIDVEKRLNEWKEELYKLLENDVDVGTDIEFYEHKLNTDKDINLINIDETIDFNY